MPVGQAGWSFAAERRLSFWMARIMRMGFGSWQIPFRFISRKKVTLILGILGDKEYRRMAEQILPFAETVILTEPHSERRLDVFSLARSVSDFSGTVEMEKEIEAA